MLALNQIPLIAILVPLIGGIALMAIGPRIGREWSLGIAGTAVVLTLLATILLINSVTPIGPQLLSVLQVNGQSLQHRLDGFSGLLALGIGLIVGPLLLWITAPRHSLADTPVIQQAIIRMGAALIAEALALGAVLNDNLLMIVVCWLGIFFMGWLISREEVFQLPSISEEWLDLAVLVIGPVFFLLVMLIPINATKVHTLSLLDLTGRAPTNGTSLFSPLATILLIFVLAFASGVYPFTLWVRHTVQVFTTEAIAIILLLGLPLGAVQLGRLIALVETWPTVTIGPTAITLNVLVTVLGMLTIFASAIILLTEQDVPVMTAALATLLIGWMFVAVGTNSTNGAIALVLLLLVYTLAIGTLMAVWVSLEWTGTELTLDGIRGLAQELPFHFVAAGLASASATGVPLFSGFAAMILTNQAFLGQGGVTPLAAVIIWGSTVLALLGTIRIFTAALTPIVHEFDSAEQLEALNGIRREGVLALIPSALLLLLGIAPELLFLESQKVPGAVPLAAAALLPGSITAGTIDTTGFGWTINGSSWQPGILWLLALGGAGIVLLLGRLTRTQPQPAPAFAGGQTLLPEHLVDLPLAPDLVALARSPLLLPGPRSWREDIGATDEELAHGADEAGFDDMADLDEDDGMLFMPETDEVDGADPSAVRHTSVIIEEPVEDHDSSITEDPEESPATDGPPQGSTPSTPASGSSPRPRPQQSPRKGRKSGA